MIGALVRLLGSVFTLKTFIGGLMMTILGIVLYNLCVTTIQELLNFTINQIAGQTAGDSPIINSPTISGFAGWFIAQIKIPEAFSVMVSCISIKFILRKIPFLHW